MKHSMKATLPGIVGCILMIAVILLCVPFTIPRIFGIEIYRVLTESMEPEYPAGSVIYIKHTEAGELAIGDVVTYRLGTNTDLTQTHRIVAIDYENATLTTQGDANEVEDITPVPFGQVIGKPVLCIPHLANVYAFFKSVTGMLLFALCFAFALFLFLFGDTQKKMEEMGKTAIRKEADAGKSKNASLGLILLGVILILAAGLIVFFYAKPYLTADRIYNEMEENYLLENANNPADSSEEVDDQTTDENLDMEGLLTENPDIIAWIKIEGTSISYPILQTSDNVTYLNKAADGRSSKLGSIFLDCNCSSDFSDAHSIIYGHNTRNGKMFGPLNNYVDESFLKAHPYITIISDEGTYTYRIFSVHEALPSDATYTYGYGHDVYFEEYLSYITGLSLFDTGVSVSKDDTIITLSTCTPGDGDARFAVHGVRMN